MSDITNTADAIIGDEAAPYVLISTAQRDLGGVIFDVTIREIHSDESVVTVNPTQNGTPTSDNLFDQPSVLEITAGSSDSTAGYPGYAQQVYEALLALRATKTPFDVSTGKRHYTNMVFSNIVVTTDETSEFALMVTARLQQVLRTDVTGSALTSVNQAYPAQTAPETKVGLQTLKPVSAPAFGTSLVG